MLESCFVSSVVCGGRGCVCYADVHTEDIYVMRWHKTHMAIRDVVKQAKIEPDRKQYHMIIRNTYLFK